MKAKKQEPVIIEDDDGYTTYKLWRDGNVTVRQGRDCITLDAGNLKTLAKLRRRIRAAEGE